MFFYTKTESKNPPRSVGDKERKKWKLIFARDAKKVATVKADLKC